LRFARTSPPSGCAGDLHPQAVEHARHTTKPLRGRTFGVASPSAAFANIGIAPEFLLISLIEPDQRAEHRL
jgi:hypothetical protein